MFVQYKLDYTNYSPSINVSVYVYKYIELSCSYTKILSALTQIIKTKIPRSEESRDPRAHCFPG